MKLDCRFGLENDRNVTAAVQIDCNAVKYRNLIPTRGCVSPQKDCSKICQVHGEALASCLEYTVKLMAWLLWSPVHFLVKTSPCLERASAIGERSCCNQLLSLFCSLGLRHNLGNTSQLLFSAKTFLICDVSLDSPSHCLIVGGEGAAVQNCSSRLSMRRAQRFPYFVGLSCQKSK